MSDARKVSTSSASPLLRIYYSRLAAAGSRRGPASCLVPDKTETVQDIGKPQLLEDGRPCQADCDGLGGAQKQAMRSLNARLASYLERVHSLDRANAQLELQIQEWYEKRTPATHDFSGYEKTIADLRTQIKDARLSQTRTFLQIDNCKRVVKEFQVKYENELRLQQGISAESKRLQKKQNDLTLSKSSLETEVEILKEELIKLKESQKEDMDNLQEQRGHQENKDISCTPGLNLTKALGEMRGTYEAMAKQNRKDAKAEFAKKSKALKQEVRSGAQTLNIEESKAAELRHTLQDLESELQELHRLKAVQEDRLQETQAGHASRIQRIQGNISRAEAGLAKIWAQLQLQGKDNKALLELTSYLKMEIITYQLLLEGEESRISVLLKRPIVPK
ncbi:keratin, type I cytoskeletal 13-like [Rhinatrema bivittatum]|uniref:keratin, type I cytoskeletal 13-like n=1 Tax=Rhinatrema bivittatum TaxID=194408 RepID=UPI00112B6E49|nr:keratin, type I cytoskeletal 13-like [Rhinatrema bivittatum]